MNYMSQSPPGVKAGKIDEFWFGKNLELVCKEKSIPFRNFLDSTRDYKEGIDFQINGLNVDFSTYPYESPRKEVIKVYRDEDCLESASLETVIQAILKLSNPGVIELPGWKIERR